MTALADKLGDLSFAAVKGWTGLRSRFRRSAFGYDNPRTGRLTSGMDYFLFAMNLGAVNVRKWLAGERELFPLGVLVQTINRCNARCPSCPYPYTVHFEERGVMSDELFQKVADECAAAPELLMFVPMSKNEPLLDLALEDRVAYFKRRCRDDQAVEVVTNGQYLTPDRFEALVDSGVDLLTISLNALSREVHEEVMTGVSWDAVTANLEAIGAAGNGQTNVYLRFIRQQINDPQKRLFKKKWRRLGFNVFTYAINNRSDTVEKYTAMEAHRSRLELRFYEAVSRSMGNLCPYAFSFSSVLQNGDVPSCPNDWANRDILGNVTRQPLREIFNGPRMQEIRELMAAGRYDAIDACRNCSFRIENSTTN